MQKTFFSLRSHKPLSIGPRRCEWFPIRLQMMPYQQNAKAIVKSRRPPIMPPTMAPFPDIGEPVMGKTRSDERSQNNYIVQ